MHWPPGPLNRTSNTGNTGPFSALTATIGSSQFWFAARSSSLPARILSILLVFPMFFYIFFFHVLYEFWLAHGPILMDMSKFWSNSDGKIQVSVQFWWNNPSLGPVLMEKSKCWVQFWWNNPSLGPFFIEKSKCWVQFWWNNPSLGKNPSVESSFDGTIQVWVQFWWKNPSVESSFDGTIQGWVRF